MIRISLAWILEVMSSIERLEQIDDNTDQRKVFWCFSARGDIQKIFEQSIYAPYLKISREKATTLISVLDQICEPEHQFSITDLWLLRGARTEFKNVFLAELSILPAFLVSEKEGYDLNTLTDKGYKLFPASLSQKCPNADEDMMAVGKTLAFELATACGFHIFRVTETVLKRYWDCVSKGQPHPSLKTIGGYAKELESKNLGEKKTRETLKQLSKLHRNPVIHPDVTLTVEEVIGTLGIARSVISSMLNEIPDATK